MFRQTDHTFAVCVYGKSEYLEACIESLERQTVKSRIILCTATPGEELEKLAASHNLTLFVRNGEPGIARDWNYAYKKAETPLVTLAHQDDIYEPSFLEKTLEALNQAEHPAVFHARLNQADRPLIAFSDYYEIRDGEKVYSSGSRLLRIKKFMQLPLRVRPFQKSRRIRRMILSFGSPVCCPSVTYVKENLLRRIFSEGFKADLDWQAWERLSRLTGSFCYIPEALMGHRIHGGSATTKVIGENRNRSQEDLEMFRKFWPEKAAKLLNHFYSSGQDSNNI